MAAARASGPAASRSRVCSTSRRSRGSRVNVANVGFKYGPAIDATRPIVLFTPYPQAGSGWRITALRQTANAFCRGLPKGA